MEPNQYVLPEGFLGHWSFDSHLRSVVSRKSSLRHRRSVHCDFHLELCEYYYLFQYYEHYVWWLIFPNQSLIVVFVGHLKVGQTCLILTSRMLFGSLATLNPYLDAVEKLSVACSSFAQKTQPHSWPVCRPSFYYHLPCVGQSILVLTSVVYHLQGSWCSEQKNLVYDYLLPRHRQPDHSKRLHTIPKGCRSRSSLAWCFLYSD